MAEVSGYCSDRFADLKTAFEASFDAGTDVGASLVIHHKGETVVDLWGGHTDEAKTTLWAEDTLVNVWSTTKTMTFLVALMLADRGDLDFDAPVARYWPEFAANGKEGVLVLHLMGHTAGLPGLEEVFINEDVADWDAICSALAAQAPWWEPGTASGYHALTQGNLIGEVVRRITGVTIGTFFASEVAGPLGADFFIGLPESEEHRVSIVIPPVGDPMIGISHESIAMRTFRSPHLNAAAPQHRWWREAEIPAAGGHGNARSVAAVQAIITGRGESNGVRLLSEKGVDRAFETQADGIDLVLGLPLRMGMGYGLSNELLPIGDRACFWGGYGGSVIFMDQEAELTVSYMMNLMLSGVVGDMRGFGHVFAASAAAAS
ncbi:MAG: serine hydrolase domain-containing protein [Actinomycetes bacterium]